MPCEVSDPVMSQICSALGNIGIGGGARIYPEDSDLVVGAQGEIMCKQMRHKITSNLRYLALLF